jgi:hypothetical protein
MTKLLIATVLLAGFCLGNVVQAQDKISSDTVARVIALLEGSGYQYSKLTPNAWSMTFRGKNKASVEILIVPDRDDLVLLSVIADRTELDNNATALRQLLKANATLPERVAVMVDSDNDYIVQLRNPLKQLNSTAFNEAVLTIANSVDDIYGTVKGTGAVSSPPRGTSVTYRSPRTATQVMEILNARAAVSVNSNLWKETKSREPNRREFEHVKGDGYAMIISERIQVPLAKLRDIALENAREASPDAKIVEEQRRVVNGTDVLMLRLDGTINGVAFSYLGYYYGGAAGTIQVLTYTGQNLFDEFRPDFEDFLNGFHLK